MTDVMAGQVSMFFASLPDTQGGKLRAVAVTDRVHSPILSQVPTVAESGLPNCKVSEWHGVFVPVVTPASIVERLSKELAAVLKEPDIRARREAMGTEIVGSSLSELDAFRRAELARWSRLAKDNNLKLE